MSIKFLIKIFLISVCMVGHGQVYHHSVSEALLDKSFDEKGLKLEYELGTEISLIGEIKNLTELELIGIGDISLINFAELNNLRILRIEECRLNDETISLLRNQGLQEIYIINCGLLKFPIELLTPSLTSLVLTNNKIDSIPQEVFTSNFIRRLDMTGNKISNLYSAGVLNNKMEWISLEGNKLTTFPNFSQFNKLKAVIVRNNLITNIDSNNLPQSLKVLSLSQNKINYIHPQAFSNTHLNGLFLDRNRLDSAFVFGTWSDSLLMLDLSLNKIDSFVHFELIENVERLYLSSNSISFLKIEGFENLNYLDVSGTNLEQLFLADCPILEEINMSYIKGLNCEFIGCPNIENIEMNYCSEFELCDTEGSLNKTNLISAKGLTFWEIDKKLLSILPRGCRIFISHSKNKEAQIKLKLWDLFHKVKVVLV